MTTVNDRIAQRLVIALGVIALGMDGCTLYFLLHAHCLVTAIPGGVQ